MKLPVLVLLVAVSACSPAAKESARPAPEPPSFEQVAALERVGPDHYRRTLDSGKRVVFVNLTADQTSYLPGTLHHKAYTETEFADRLRAEKPDVIYTYCSCPDDYSAAAIALTLKAQGYPNVFPIAGGVHTLKAQAGSD